MKKILIIQTGKSAGLERYKTYADMFADVMQLKKSEVEAIDLKDGDLPKAPSNYKAVIISGSPAMITDDKSEPWYAPMEAWLHGAIDAALPILGVCYGHQMLTQMLGGKVEYHPDGDEFGTEMVTLTADCAIVKGLPKKFPAQMSHSQTVTAMPNGAKVIGHSKHDKHQIIKYNETTFSTQFHPEFSQETIMARIKARADKDQGLPGVYIEKMSDATETPEARQVLFNFLELVKK